MHYEEFRKSILKVNEPRHHKIKDSLGIRDVFNWCRKNCWDNIKVSMKELEFYKIVQTVNKLLAEELKQGHDVKFPQRMGQLEVRKYSTYVKLKNGKIRTNRRVDWGNTLKLWNEDDEARENKIRLRIEDKEVFTIFYNTMFANFKNKTIYQFRPNRELSIAIKKAGREGIIDAYKIGL